MNVAILLSGGIGTRIGGDIPKQYIMVKGKPIIYYTLRNIMKSASIDAIVVVAAPEWQKTVLDIYKDILNEKDGNATFNKDVISDYKNKISFVLPGENRQESIINGLKICKNQAINPTYVMIHDAVRPLLSAKMIDDYFASLWSDSKIYDGLMPVLPMKDTVYISNDGKSISSLIDRTTVFAGQAPEIFSFTRYYEANMQLSKEDILKINGSTEPAIIGDMKIKTVPGEEGNFKITTPEDLKRFEERVTVS